MMCNLQWPVKQNSSLIVLYQQFVRLQAIKIISFAFCKFVQIHVMSVIRLPLLYVGSKGEKTLYTLFASGTNLSCIGIKHLENLEIPVNLGITKSVSTLIEAHYIEVKYRVTLDFYVNDVLLSDEFLVVPSLKEEAIIGAATLQKWRIKLNFKGCIVEVDPKVAKMQLI